MPGETPPIIQQLIRDHRNMARLLDVLQEELERYRQTKSADFEILSRIVDYVRNFPELRHHPREDLIFRHLEYRDPAGARQAEAILAEHWEMAALTRKCQLMALRRRAGATLVRPLLGVNRTT